MKCKICGNETKLAFNAKILNKYDVNYYKCNNCDFLCTEEPYWLDEAYSSAIANSDTGILARNLDFRKKIPIVLNLLKCNLDHGKFLDYAGGGGIFVRLMRDIGINFYWYDKYCSNWVANGFEANLTKKYAAVTTFECFEHFANPLCEIRKLFAYSDTVIFSTVVLPAEIPETSWWYYSCNDGQHIAFYSKITLKYIANKLGYNVYQFDKLYCFTKQKISPMKIKIFNRMLKFKLGNILINIFFKLITKNLKPKTVDDMYKIRNRNVI